MSLALVVAVGWASASAVASGLPGTPPDHVVIVVMENRAVSQIIGSAEAPYINHLAATRAFFAQ
jgi:hypothetical protein